MNKLNKQNDTAVEDMLLFMLNETCSDDKNSTITDRYKSPLYVGKVGKGKVTLIIIITSRSFNAENLISHDIISFHDHYCNNVRAFDCMISNVDDYSQIPVNPVKDIDKKISKIKHQRFKNKVKEAMLEIIVNLIFGIIGLIILSLLT